MGGDVDNPFLFRNCRDILPMSLGGEGGPAVWSGFC